MWTPRDEFLDEVTGFVDTSTWITEWQYPLAKPLLAERADLLVWLDLPFRVSLTRLIRRTFRRRIRCEEIWNANVEPPLWTFFTSQDHIVRWAIRTRSQYKVQVPELERMHRDLVIVHLRSQREVDAWVLGPLVDSLQAADR